MRRWNPEIWNNHTPHGEKPSNFYLSAIEAFKRLATLCTVSNRKDTAVKLVYRKFIEAVRQPPRVESIFRSIDFDATWRVLHRSDISPDAKNTVWRAAHDILPVRALLAKMHISDSSACLLCQRQPETAVHIFTECDTVRPVWSYFESKFGIALPQGGAKLLYLNFDIADHDRAKTTVVVCCEVMHAIWLSRNGVRFDGEDYDARRIVRRGRAKVKLRIEADFRRQTAAEFDVAWGRHGTYATVTQGNLQFLF